MSEEASNWREAVDPSSGATYYYHRKTRETTWIRPACLDTLAPAPLGAIAVAPASEGPTATFKIRSSDHASIETGWETDVAYDGSLDAGNYGDGAADGDDEDEGEYMSYLLAQCFSESADVLLTEDPDLIDKLVGAAALARKEPYTPRRVSLRCLLLLSVGRDAPRLGFHPSQSWVTLAGLVHRWGEDGDFESGIVYCCILSLLLGGPARGVIGQDTVSVLLHWIKSLVGKNAYLMDLDPEIESTSNQGISIIDSRILQALSKCAGGQSLPGLVLILLAKQAFSSEKAAVNFIRVGGFAALQSLCINGWIPEDVSTHARLLIEHAMASSSYIRGAVLTSFVTLSKNLAMIALPSGPDPLCSNSAFSDVSPEDDDDDYVDETLEYWKASSVSLQRDVDWKPKQGTSWHVSSVLLWAQCSELRETIEGLWEEAGGELELGTNTSDAALASAVKFLHTGILFPPHTHESRIDLLKLASELGTKPMVKEACDAILQQMTAEDVESTLSVSRSLRLGELENGVNLFRISGQRPAISFISDVADLRQAISSSVLEVGQSLRAKTPPSVLNARGGGPVVRGGDYAPKVDYPSAVPETKNLRGTPSSKIKSGGIYGLLLEASGHSDAKGSQTQDGPGKKVPGKLPGDLKPRAAFGSTAVPQKGKPAASATSRAVPSSTARGGSAPVAGKRAKAVSADAHSHGAWTEGESGLFEFDTRMSLVPEREPSEREKRLSALANPKHLSPSKSPDTSDILDDAKIPKRAQSPTIAGARGRGLPSSAMAQDDFASEVEVGDSVPLVPLDPNVRSSLVLLKSRSLRRRRSVADVENEADPAVQNVRSTEIADKPSIVKKAATSRPQLQGGSATRRALVSCTKKQGCTCQDCLSSASVSPRLLREEGKAFRIRNSYDNDINNEHENEHEKEHEKEHEHESSQYDESDGEAIPSFRPEPVDVLQSRQQQQAKSYYLPPSSSDIDDGDYVELLACPDCDRKFRREALARHVGVCKKVFLQKRKVFDSKKMRLLADNLSVAKPSSSASSRRQSSKPQNPGGIAKWKQDSLAFREAMKGARDYTSAISSGVAPPPVASYQDPSYIQCPHCSRRFNQTAGERHIPVCQQIKAKPQPLKR